MRVRKEIEKSCIIGVSDDMIKSAPLKNQFLILEVLLDIREQNESIIEHLKHNK